MTRIVDGLVLLGLASRTKDPGDQRGIRITATQKGKRVLLQRRHARVEYLARRLARLSTAELRHMLAVADRIEHIVREQD
jgi:DNA-binding MarR family transcriptional regulator